MPIDPQLLDELEKSNPDLVAQYRAKMGGADQGVQSARDMQDYGGIANTAGQAMTDLGNAFGGARDVNLYNNMQNLGAAPKVVKADKAVYDGSGLEKAGAQNLARAKEDRQQAESGFMTEQRLVDLGQSRADATLDRGDKALDREDKAKTRARTAAEQDPTSQESASAREYLKQVVPSATNIQGFDKLSAAQVQKIIPNMLEKYKIDETAKTRLEEGRQRSLDRAAMMGARSQDKAEAKAGKEAEYDASVAIPGLERQPGMRPAPQVAKDLRDAKTTQDNMLSTLDAMDGLYKSTGTNMVGDDSVAQGQYAESLRMQLKDLLKLGALSASDYASLEAQVPDPTSVKENLKGVFGADSYQVKSDTFRKDLKQKLANKAKNAGYSVPAEPAPAADKPAQTSKPAWAK